jgi:hypothetical protein
LTLFLIPTYYFVMERLIARREETDEVQGAESSA